MEVNDLPRAVKADFGKSPRDLENAVLEMEINCLSRNIKAGDPDPTLWK